MKCKRCGCFISGEYEYLRSPVNPKLCESCQTSPARQKAPKGRKSNYYAKGNTDYNESIEFNPNQREDIWINPEDKRTFLANN